MSDNPNLSPRHQAIWDDLMSGMTRRDVAKKYGIHINTVDEVKRLAGLYRVPGIDLRGRLNDLSQRVRAMESKTERLCEEWAANEARLLVREIDKRFKALNNKIVRQNKTIADLLAAVKQLTKK